MSIPYSKQGESGSVPAWLPWSFAALVVLGGLALFVARDALLARLCPECEPGFGSVAVMPGESAQTDRPGAPASAKEAAGIFVEVLEREPAWLPRPATAASCAAIRDDLDHAAEALAQRANRKPTAVRASIGEALDRLARARPSPSGESGAPARVYANVVHLGRVLGADRAADLARLTGYAEPVAEPLALALFAHIDSRKVCEKESPLAGSDLGYEYGVFLLGTVGGQGYLGRRLPNTSTLARFWALVAIGDAIAAGRNPHGYDPGPAIAVTRAAIERSAFALRDQYLAELDRLAALGRGGTSESR